MVAAVELAALSEWVTSLDMHRVTEDMAIELMWESFGSLFVDKEEMLTHPDFIEEKEHLVSMCVVIEDKGMDDIYAELEVSEHFVNHHVSMN